MPNHRNRADYGMLLVLAGAVIVLASNPPDWVWWVEAAAIILTAVMWLVAHRRGGRDAEQ